MNDVSTNKKTTSTQQVRVNHGYKKAIKATCVLPSIAKLSDKTTNNTNKLQNDFELQDIKLDIIKPSNFNPRRLKRDKNNRPPEIYTSNTDIPERIFMNGLVKHTAIALAIIIPLAAFSAYAAPQVLPVNATTANATSDKTTMATLAIEPSAIIHKSASVPTTVDSVDLEKYAGTWYEIGRLPMYFQRNCASNVTATYTGKTDGSGITVLNQCTGADSKMITAEGIAKPADNTGSKLKVSFLPSWIRWLPVGRADYWVLARDANYQTALVGTPDNDYLWLLARSPNITQQTYAKYRQIAQQQGYDLKEFKLTPHTNQTVSLDP
ncbi:lipocalin family protein [Psychrobacter sp. CAL346-MNA-CIBAN-0220]|uniref:lipocalin family protein n=1 Tax=Psychrobacter sp. CAL346-MNA-CIBAN-0220 TaxID=3140457 RepID=UPI0033337624